MKRRDLIQKILLGGITFIILLTALDSCSKDDTTSKEKVFVFDLSNPTYYTLSNYNGYMIVTEDIIVAYLNDSYQGTWVYVAAKSTCPSCGNAIVPVTSTSVPIIMNLCGNVTAVNHTLEMVA
jgi:hypothetical protein